MKILFAILFGILTAIVIYASYILYSNTNTKVINSNDTVSNVVSVDSIITDTVPIDTII